MSSHWETADNLARSFAEAAGEGRPAPTTVLYTQLAQLAVILRDTAERVGLRAEGVDHPLEIGKTYELTLRVQATVVDKSDGHGLSYELKLEDRDFYDGRSVCVDADEITGAVAQ